ncbi:hypothetical protein K8Z61_08735 [Nocardioides sp. TRM66260-LWL]|uniref:hypothetical protein n=1 Tax=Nocardioides sp. TRM66260-LWL TaxID=2874478 RepID=UPI001CC62114|nr:hypothetical protein [Nocardioides sp. TRM66260-LWL]MBZ5734583.1 hypothetical protein [Nocardioides sp. TRM66260-LWL]
MTDRPGPHDPASLRDALARLDPAASLPPADPARTARLVEDAMAAAPDPTRRDAAAAPPRRRTPLLLGAAAVVLAAGIGGGYALTRGGDPTGPVAATDPSASASGTPSALPSPSVTLTAATPGIARCAVPSAAMLARAALAVEGTVAEADDGRATLRVDRVLKGDPGAALAVTYLAGRASAPRIEGALDLEVGRSYLVAGTEDGRLMVCGFSGPADDAGLQRLYAEAFPYS